MSHTLSTIRTDEAVKRFWKDISERLDQLHETLADLAGDVEMEMDDEDSNSSGREYKEIKKIFKPIDLMFTKTEQVIKIAELNVKRVKA